MSTISFKIEKRASTGGARAGIITTPHGTIRTPAFTLVGTKANVKGVLPSSIVELGAEVVLANTYHLYLQPGEKIVQDAGGLGKFMGWQGPTMTDSGGFQVFSLGAAFGKGVSKFKDVVRPTSDVGRTTSKHELAMYDEEVASQHGQLAIIDDEGVSFTSHLDGSLHRFTPERSVEIQHALGADVFFAFDECTSPNEPYEYQREAMERTHRWAERSLKTHRSNLGSRSTQAIFGIVQGGRHEDLRRESARAIASLGFDGIGIGGSFSKEDMHSALGAAVNELPEELPRHFLGIGEPGDMLEGIANGMDLFDCVAPTRLGRHGSIYTSHGVIHLRNGRYRNDFTSLSELGLKSDFNTNSRSQTSGFTLAYVSHLVRSNEMLGAIIASMHNLGFILQLVSGARQAILDGRFDDYRADFIRDYYG
ncbi:tRNA guanosine(34) transglycosylase Tgt [Candidatus Kaiserbacteria bacterium CG_4_9_14_3_um_filter_50_16]|nr:MAG: tRNA guanosine(34) transglycosylase Tgt [Candidatus Kaiserbacteria bacterium CG06_land_8_20_14_3_00_49_31]PIW96517.1 MAG: tRNA guanosine(34) transglycosylase Tgt [Candidatus Kaiserbacteria bacterium CG_4_8_14_3_um_filter_50_23]PJA94635.1 MAG: tRNA guanosine(34) transglycosylase Tgt [Candidatus Kaiserbacteria bacterium CG_4_9_14_3_um_filter_50_16]